MKVQPSERILQLFFNLLALADITHNPLQPAIRQHFSADLDRQQATILAQQPALRKHHLAHFQLIQKERLNDPLRKGYQLDQI